MTVSLTFPTNRGGIPLERMRQRVDLPDFARLPAAAQDTLRQVDEVADRLTQVCTDRAGYLDVLLPPPRGPLPDIHHQLTPLFPRVDAAIPLVGARAERRILNARAPQILASMRSGCAGELKAAVVAVASDLTGSIGLRRRDRCASPDRHGCYVVYPNPTGIDRQLDSIASWLALNTNQPVAFGAMGSLVAITNCHPLEDGNGRLSRIIANTVMGYGDPAAPYIPWREIALFSRGGFIVRVREAELRSDWQPLARFMLAALKWWTALITDHVARTGP